MATLRKLDGSRESLLEGEVVVGRSPTAGLHLSATYVSTLHAVFRWDGTHWLLRDLSSRNGTTLDGKALQAGETRTLAAGSVVSFGHEAEAWELLDAEPPTVMIVPLAGGRALPVHNDVLGIPDETSPAASLFHDADGLWKLETSSGTLLVLEDGTTFEVAGNAWRFSCRGVAGITTAVSPALTSSTFALRFSVSRDEEHVALVAQTATRVIDLGSRAHNYLLLTLARQRLTDAERGIPDGSCGWVYQDELLDSLRMQQTQLNIDIHRIRRHFAKAGLSDALRVVERRPRTKQVRIGCSDLAVRLL